MEMSLLKKDDKTWTRFKCSLKEFSYWQALLEIKYSIDTKEPSKKNSRFIYFEKEGDLINGKNKRCCGTCQYRS